ncbi:histidine kinase [Alkalihalobacillus alcalophilus ATCC 27647 = CGMCC 1.3604]|uniref:histidine kinase n=1 Tax=Alkalihalobacillus alcalophilus ATCC 27647 = CGMCC 1.3604 TaxID=1218173 RepID=A0A094YTL9_ALKAL|nr:HAMP domain-containing sensor histidine kinase [Alkalihalobacillus alcalophilus]KGA96807.1 hypothetical protein BALCAV_0214135 [Alkalihalobacillus alcalophilus ATCC 27647 = CGMCC 1.3604]MED1561377.1 HAMP domain-containing sensor histidine kinase [Alkalihalobacillus alcalophilus]THG92406.1 histidine kinase [Alkalihalobacillus alcalophilus ATCC 27647 = CGMCC 1.3604]
MKLKSFLMFSYLIVMILPVAVLYLLYLGLNQYWQQEYFRQQTEATLQFAHIEELLKDPGLYDFNPLETYDMVADLTSDNIAITLYRSDGLVLYQSHQRDFKPYFSFTNVHNLYRNIGDIETTHQNYRLKQPVLSQAELKGFYEITIARDAWLQTYQNYNYYYLALFIAIFTLIYLIVLFLLHYKLNKPLKSLEHQMDAFAKGKQTEKIIPRSNDEISRLILHFENMKNELIKQNDAVKNQQNEKEWIVSTLSHDLKTPLTVIRTYSEALLKGTNLTEQEKRDYEQILFEKMQYMEHLINDLAIYTSIQSPSFQPKLVKVDGEEFFDMLLSGYEELAADKDISLQLIVDAPGEYLLDPKQMIRVVDNLVENGLRYTNKGNVLSLAVISSNQNLPEWVFSPFKQELEHFRQNDTLLLVQNEGSFIPEDQLLYVLQPFYQVEQARTKGGSSGLGLSIAQLLMQKQKGDLTICSKADFGTLVACRLPER